MIEHLRTGDVDFAAEARAAIGGYPGNFAEAAGYLSLLLISAETGGQNLEREHTTALEQPTDGQE